jgi:hypothetical protein
MYSLKSATDGSLEPKPCPVGDRSVSVNIRRVADDAVNPRGDNRASI